MISRVLFGQDWCNRVVFLGTLIMRMWAVRSFVAKGTIRLLEWYHPDPAMDLLGDTFMVKHHPMPETPCNGVVCFMNLFTIQIVQSASSECCVFTIWLCFSVAWDFHGFPTSICSWDENFIHLLMGWAYLFNISGFSLYLGVPQMATSTIWMMDFGVPPMKQEPSIHLQGAGDMEKIWKKNSSSRCATENRTRKTGKK